MLLPLPFLLSEFTLRNQLKSDLWSTADHERTAGHFVLSVAKTPRSDTRSLCVFQNFKRKGELLQFSEDRNCNLQTEDIFSTQIKYTIDPRPGEHSAAEGADTLKSHVLPRRAAPSCCGVAPLGLCWAAFGSS